MKTRIRGRFDPLPDYDIEAYLCGELTGTALAALERELPCQPELVLYLKDRERTRSQFHLQQPLRLPERSQLQRPGRAQRMLHWSGALAALAMCALLPQWLAKPATRSSQRLETRDTIRSKGTGLHAELYAKRGDQIWKHRPEIALHAGDQLRLSVNCPQPAYLSLLGRDTDGRIQIYYDRLVTGTGHYTVPDSLILDDARGDEEWFLVLPLTPVPASHFVEQLASGADARELDAPNTVLRLHKESP